MRTNPAILFLTYQTQNKAGYSGIYRDNKTLAREHHIGMVVSEETVKHRTGRAITVTIATIEYILETYTLCESYRIRKLRRGALS